MKKKILLTLLLALVVVAGQAQQRSGLNLCLRDEATGEWLIGLFDEYAIYDCDYWSYAEVGKGRLVLTHDKQHKEIRLKKGSVAIILYGARLADCCQTISAAADVCAIAYVTDCDRGSSCISCLIRRDMDRYDQCAGLL